MLIGKSGRGCQRHLHVDPGPDRDPRARPRERPDGPCGFTDFFYFLVTGREPSEQQRFFLDLLLVAIAEHGLTPTAQAARMTLRRRARIALQGAVAAGILGCGTVVLGHAPRLCGRDARRGARRVDAGADRRRKSSRDIAAEVRGRREKMPGFGHPHPPPGRPARRAHPGAGGRARRRRAACRPARALHGRRSPQAWGRPLPLNVSVPDRRRADRPRLPASDDQGASRSWRAPPGSSRHLAEEQRGPIGFLLAHHAEEAIAYDPAAERGPRHVAGTRRSRRCPGREQQPQSTTRSIASRSRYLFERSRFFRDKLRGARLPRRREAVGGLDDIAALPLTEKDELRASRSDADPIGTPSRGAARGGRAHLLDQRHHRRAELHPAHGGRPRELGRAPRRAATRASGLARGQRLISTYNAGPFVAGAALDAFTRLGLCHIPVGTGNTERLLDGRRSC